MLAGRLLREAVLQQSALSANDASCAPAKTAALVDAVLAVVDRCRGSWSTAACPPRRVEEVDFGPLLRAREETGPDDVGRRRERRVATMLGPARGADMTAHDAVAGAIEYTDVARAARAAARRRGASRASAGTSPRWSGWTPASVRHGLVLEVDRDLAVVQVLEGTDGHAAARHAR